MKYDVVIIGAGPAGIFTAIELIRKGANKKIMMVEKGQPIEKRRCPKSKTNKCVNCKPYCHITTGFSGAGAFSDGKLSLSPEVGGQLPELAVGGAVAGLVEGETEPFAGRRIDSSGISRLGQQRLRPLRIVTRAFESRQPPH